MQTKTRSARVAKPLVTYSLGVMRLENNTYKVFDAQKLVKKNQFSRHWAPVDSREVARELNRGRLEIK